MRQIIAESVHIDEFSPENSEVWAEAYKKFLAVTKL